MKKGIGFAVVLVLAAFAFWGPLGFAYALFTALCGLVLGAWMLNTGVALGLLYLLASLAMGLLTVVNVCIGLAPGAGTLAFGSGMPSIVFNLPSLGVAQATFSFAVLTLMFVPAISGVLLARWLSVKFGELQTKKLAAMDLS